MVKASFALIRAWIDCATATVYLSRLPEELITVFADSYQICASSRSLKQDLSGFDGPRTLDLRNVRQKFREFLSSESMWRKFQARESTEFLKDGGLLVRRQDSSGAHAPANT